MSIINRSYYAMFYAALALLQTVGKTPSKHAGVMSLFDQEFVLKGLLPRELGRNFHRAFTQRQSADYQVTSPPTREAAVELWQQAREFVQAAKLFLSQQKAG